MDPNSIRRRCTSCKSRLNPADRICPICGESAALDSQPLMIASAKPALISPDQQLEATPITEMEPVLAPVLEQFASHTEPDTFAARWSRFIASITRLVRRHWQLVGLFVASIAMVLVGGYLIGWGMNVRSDLTGRQTVRIIQPAPTETGSHYGIGGRIDAP